MDTEEERLQKSLLVVTSFSAAFASIFWGLLYLFLGEIAGAFITLGYSLVSFITLVIFGSTKKITFYRNSQLLLILILPFLLMYVLGGFVASSNVIIWIILAPIGALLFYETKYAVRWFLLSILLIITSGLIEYSVYFSNNISIIFYVANLSIPFTIIFFVVYYFVNKKNEAYDLLKVVAQQQFSSMIDGMHIENKTERELEPVLLMIVSENGTAKYSRFFGYGKQVDPQLISGFLSAINAFSKETFGTSLLKQIHYNDFQMLFEITRGYRMVYAFRGDQNLANEKFDTFIKNLQGDEFNYLFENAMISFDEDKKLDSLCELL